MTQPLQTNSIPTRRVVLALAAVGVAAVVAVPAYRLWQRSQAVARVRELGGHVGEGQPTFPEWAAAPRAVVGDAVLAPLAKPSHYKAADLWFKPATDADVEKLAAVTDLMQLDLSGTKVTDRGLAALKALTRLESLELVATRVTDAGLAHLRGMTKLGRLRLDHCQGITDAAIPHLQAIPSPEMYVNLKGTKVTSIRAGELRVRPAGDGTVLRVGQTLVIEGSCTVVDPDYALDEIDVDILGNEEGSDEASHFGSGQVRPTKVGPGRYEFRFEVPAPKRPGEFAVEASTLARLHGYKAFYTVGRCRVRVLPAADGRPGAPR